MSKICVLTEISQNRQKWGLFCRTPDSDNNTSWFQKFKEYPGSASITMLQEYLIRHSKITEFDFGSINLSSISPEFSGHLYQLGRYYDAWEVKRFRPAKRYTLMLAFLHEAQKVMMDYVIQLHDQYISNITRECKNNHVKALKLYKRKNEKAIGKIERVIDYILELEDEQKISIRDVYKQSTTRSALQQARDDMHEYQRLSLHGYAKLIQNRHASMRRYFADFIELPFLVEKGNEALEESINLIRRLDAKTIASIPDNIETNFIDHQIRFAMRDENGFLKGVCS